LLRMTACVASTCSTVMYVHWRQGRSISHITQPCSSSLAIQDSRPWTKHRNPVIVSVVHHRQNPSDSTSPVLQHLKKKKLFIWTWCLWKINKWHCLILPAATCHCNGYSARGSQNAVLSYRNGFLYWWRTIQMLAEKHSDICFMSSLSPLSSFLSPSHTFTSFFLPACFARTVMPSYYRWQGLNTSLQVHGKYYDVRMIQHTHNQISYIQSYHAFQQNKAFHKSCKNRELIL
jgi:hypothetical protein